VPQFKEILMSILRFHWIRFFGAAAALVLALMYLFGYEQPALAGFLVIGVYATITCVRIQRGTQPAKCDLCGRSSKMKVEYDHGFSNVKLIVECPDCGRIVNKAKQAIKPGRESDPS